jgi:hypothetical protein
MEREKNMSIINTNVLIKHTLHMYFVVGHIERGGNEMFAKLNALVNVAKSTN